MPRKSKPERYATWWHREVTLYRGEHVIEQGTIKEIAERWQVQKNYIYWLTMGVAHRRADLRKDQTKALRGIVVS